MCQIFANQPPEAYESHTRSMRIGGHATSIRLENAFWRTLEEVAAAQDMSLSRFITTLHDEVVDRHGEVRNFASLLRCCCLVHMNQTRHQPDQRQVAAHQLGGGSAVAAE